ncbi:MAG: efflux RND transporter periplasmic adaptor subunit [Vicinamibacterales bacterium]
MRRRRRGRRRAARAARAALDLAKATHGRIAALFARKSATAQEMDDAAALAAAEARAASAEARVQEAGAGIEQAVAASDAATAMAGFLHVTAPFDGVVTEKLVNVGDMATPGLPLVRLEDTRAYRLEVRVDESQAARLGAGAGVDVTLDGASAPVNARVAEVSRAIDAGSRSFLVKIDLPVGTEVRSGAFGRARLPGDARRALVVPADAIVRHGQVTSVFVADGGHARLRLVRLQGDEVLAGLAAGDQVIVAPPPALVDGRAISGGVK